MGRVWGGSHLHGAVGVGAHAVQALRRGGRWLRGEGGGVRGQEHPQGSGTPVCQGCHRERPPQQKGTGQGQAGDTHTLALLPFATGDAREAALALGALQERDK